MEIILVRHGRPAGVTNPKLSAAGFAKWIKDYKNSSVAADSLPPSYLKEKLEKHYLISSDLKRAIQSAELCTGKQPFEKFNSLREMDIPRYKLPLILRANAWLFLNRFLWMLGVTGTVESYKEAKKRAKITTQQLIELATENDKIVVFGHGYINFWLCSIGLLAQITLLFKPFIHRAWKRILGESKYLT